MLCNCATTLAFGRRLATRLASDFAALSSSSMMTTLMDDGKFYGECFFCFLDANFLVDQVQVALVDVFKSHSRRGFRCSFWLNNVFDNDGILLRIEENGERSIYRNHVVLDTIFHQ